MAAALDRKQRELLPWTPSQRAVLIGGVLALSAYLASALFVNRRYVADPPIDPQSNAALLQSRVDPNTADWQTLAAIPQLGEKRARAIVAYREEHAHDHAGPVFLRPADLIPIKGIGDSTIENLRPYLLFPTIEPTTDSSD